MTVELTVIISLGCALLGALLGIQGYKRNTTKDAEEDGKSLGVMMAEIGYVKAGIDGIKLEQVRQREEQQRQWEEQQEGYTVLRVEVAKVEASAKQAHKRIDEMQKKEC